MSTSDFGNDRDSPPADFMACDALISSRYPIRKGESRGDKVKRLRFALQTYSEAWTRATSRRERYYLLLREYDTLQSLRDLRRSADDAP